MKNMYLENKKFYDENRENDGIKISFESLSRSGKPEETVRYPFTITNTSSEPVNLKFEVEEAGWEVMEVALDLGEEQTVEIKPEKTYEMELQVKVSKRVAPGGYENQKLIIKKEDNKSGQQEMLDEIIFTTLRYLPHPYLLHTEEGWENVKDKMDNYEWMAEILEKIEKKHVSWEVPEIDPSGDFIFERDSCKPAFPLSVAWKLTANKEKAEKFAAKIKEFLLKLSDPDKGYPETGKGSSHYAVKEGLLFRHAAAAYDLICETDILTEVEKSQIEATFNKFIRDWSRYEKKIINKDGQFTMGIGLDNEHIGNHHLSIVVAGIYISLILQDFNHLNRFLYGPGGFTEQMANGMMDDGFWYETDPGYHMLVADFFVKIARACKPWGINLFDFQAPPKYNRYAGLREDKGRQKFGPNYRNFRNISDMVDCLVPLADYRGVIFANNKSWEVRLGGGHLEQFYEHYRKPEYAWALRQKKRGSLQTLLYGIPELPEVEDSRPEIVNSENAGFYVLRSSFDKEEPEKQLQAVLKCGTPGGGHRHYDQTDLLSIMRYGRSFYNPQASWALKEYEFIIDDMFNEWIVKSANHNMVIVDQGNQGIAEPQKLLFYNGNHFKSAAVQIKAPWTLEGKSLGTVLQRRLLTVTDNYMIIADYLEDKGGNDESHIYDWLIHPVGLKEIEADKNNLITEKAQFADRGAGQYIQNCKWYHYDNICLQFKQEFNDDDLNRDGILHLDIYAVQPDRGKMMIGDYPEDENIRKQKRSTVSFRTEGSKTRYITVIEAFDKESTIKQVKTINNNRLQVELKDGRIQEHKINDFFGDCQEVSVAMKENYEDQIVFEENSKEI